MLKVCLILILFFSSIDTISAQSSDDCKYSSALLYLEYSPTIPKLINDYFKKLKKKESLNIYVSSKISFIGNSGFDSKNFEIANNLLSPLDSTFFDKNIFFSSYNSEYLKGLNKKANSKLFLAFSKPFDNKLLAEITIYNPESVGYRKYGPSMLICFVFNENSGVKAIYHIGRYYN